MKPLKIRNNDWKNDYPSSLRSLKYGKNYYVAFAGITDGIEFELKKKKKIRCIWIDGRVSYESLKRIRKIVNDVRSIQFIAEVENKE